MTLRRFGVVLLAIFALGLMSAGTALATEEFEASHSVWYTGAPPGTKLPSSSTKTLKSSAASALTLQAPVGGVTLKIGATGVECVGCSIKNPASTAEIVGKLKFTGVTVIEPDPVHCMVNSSFETNSLVASVGMTRGSTTKATVAYIAPIAPLATVTIFGGGCSVTGTYKLTGTIYFEPANATGVFAKNQQFKTNETIQHAAGTTTSLKLEGNPAFMSGTINNVLSPEGEYAFKES